MKFNNVLYNNNFSKEINNQNLNKIRKHHEVWFIKWNLALFLFWKSLYVSLMSFSYADFRNVCIWLQVKFKHVNSKPHFILRSNFSPLTSSWDQRCSREYICRMSPVFQIKHYRILHPWMFIIQERTFCL